MGRNASSERQDAQEGALVGAAESPDADGESVEALKVVLATEHYLDSVSKVELARRHGLSRFQVARLLDEARDEGIVRIEIVDPHGRRP